MRDVRFVLLSARLPKELELALNAHMQSEEQQNRELVWVQITGGTGELVALVATRKRVSGASGPAAR